MTDACIACGDPVPSGEDFCSADACQPRYSDDAEGVRYWNSVVGLVQETIEASEYDWVRDSTVGRSR